MIARLRPFYVFLLVLFLISLVYLQGVASVPFHPDESTFLYISTDIGRVFKNPASLFWYPGADDELQLLNPPLVQYAVEIGRRLGGFPPLPENWGWRRTWEENEQRGALPSPGMLLMARLAIAGLFPFSLLFLYLATRLIANEFTAWVAVLLMATNSLILLHTRRAMGEGVLIFTLTFSIWVLMKAIRRPWLVALPAALAFCAKASLAPLAIVGLLAVVWQPGETGPAGRRFRQILLYGITFTSIIYLLTPIAWRHPLQTFQAAKQARQNMMAYAVAEYPAQAIHTPVERVTSLINQMYFAPLMFYEDATFAENIRAAQTAYLANPMNSLFHTPMAGGILLGLGLFGFAAGGYQASNHDPIKKRRFILLLAATLLQTTAVLAAVPLNWQRYYLPLVPFACIWTAYGVNQLKELARPIWSPRVIAVQ